MSLALPDNFAWIGNHNQFRLWFRQWSRDVPGGGPHWTSDLNSWQKAWQSDADSTTAPSILLDPQQWLLPPRPEGIPRMVGVDYSKWRGKEQSQQ